MLRAPLAGLFFALTLAACAISSPSATPAPVVETTHPTAAIPDLAPATAPQAGSDLSESIVTTAANAAASPHCLFGCPLATSQDDQIIRRHLYTLANNPHTKFADWVAYVVRVEYQGEEESRNWHVDPDIAPNDTLELQDYRGAPRSLSIDRGHQAPLASFTGSDYWPETNYLSNITPQDSNLNRGRWARLEDAERELAETQDAPIYVLTGPLYEHEMRALPNADEAHRVPSGYWKVVALPDGRVVAFIFANAPGRGRYCAFIRPLAEVEQRSGLDLFPERAPSSLDGLAPEIGCPETP